MKVLHTPRCHRKAVVSDIQEVSGVRSGNKSEPYPGAIIGQRELKDTIRY